MSAADCPLPPRDGVHASCVVLPQQHWPSLLAYLRQRFAHVADSWQHRLAAGEVWDDCGQPLTPAAPYMPGQRIWYFREVADETAVPFEIDILHRDDRLLVVDKPHFLACVPGGRHLRETVLTRLRRDPALANASPIHRLDRETAGVMLFCLDPAARGGYQRLFEARAVYKSYEAIAPYRADLALPLQHRSRLEELPGGFVMREVAGEPNSDTLIELIQRRGDWAQYRLTPGSGKKHQLRAHLAALGIAIANDPWYPDFNNDKAADDFSRPLALLARRIAFTDPFDGSERVFDSRRQLAWPEDNT
ncbi:pseudouridine synthase [Vogesella oryzae]|uniref:pseudouridine synthase n=1 Tax=Vogesella oryzae TaxID=1735285 RepID=UPI001FEC9FAD|nr:pseudouridine synthase [Vogesella oryzae]